ncbi:MAG: hypothetical protein PHC34_05815 [Candidatus Gastranaerophilales bacterium]|nr:hypothetical protein [Candidatus Gastranaerophilales bacterium]
MKIKSVILVLILTFIQINICKAQDWDTYLNNYDKNQIEKPVTPQEFNKALETVKSFQKKDKKKKRKKKKGEQIQDIQPPIKEVIIPDSSGILLRLPVSVRWNNMIIPDGFYLIEKVLKDKDYFFKITQGEKIFAELQTKTAIGKYTGYSEVSVQNIGNNTVKIYYIDREMCLEAELPVYIFNSSE